jgi:hypothetical protein
MHVSIYLFGSYCEEVRLVIYDIHFSSWNDELINEFIH